MRCLLIPAFAFVSTAAMAQGSFPPQVGEEGCDAIHKDSAVFSDWAATCDLSLGLRQAGAPDSGYVTSGTADYATGAANAPYVVSLGDGGMATLTFHSPFYNGSGADFAVFENGFGSGPDAFLELAFVEVSSDGEHFFRFPAISETQDTAQTAGFGHTDASKLHNLAGKYTAGYGVPFDLDEVPDTSLLDKMNVTHVRIVDVVGSIDPALGSQDSKGHWINEPWPTNFPQSGFDLDAVGIINSHIPLAVSEPSKKQAQTMPRRCFDLRGREVDCSTVRGIFVVEWTDGTYTKHCNIDP